ncbi:alpha-hydroxy acid oxidase [Anaerosporobacter faecicola]|uniref:alpha-hydroxy acid oxidase n=1 Tax=Anaerosporobacter faecicola TaxID=2718714 RepID=UPI00143B4743|nr:alpha-hydroxy acid oxidase [Anaerosporobacter faecicola]
MKQNQAGDANRITREYFDSLLLESRYIDSDLPSTQLQLYGETFQTPIMTAALSHLHGICDNAMVEIAKGALEAKAVHWVGMGEEDEFEQITETGARTIKIIKPHKDSNVIYKKMDHAIEHNAFAVGMDIDHAFSGNGKYDVVCGLPMHAKSFEEIKEYVERSSVPFIIKGVLSVQDAEKSVKAGAKGIVVSHHHGIMQYAIPPLMILPEIVKAVDGQIPIFVDCGIESGMDVFKALALGATAVCVGRELMEPLKDGKDAVAKRINEMNLELMSIMARTGAKTLAEIDPSVIHFKTF